MATETSQTLDRGLQVLALLAETPSPRSIGEIATELDLNRTITRRLVNTLHARSLVRRDGEGRYSMGLGVLHLADSVLPELRTVAGPALRGLADELGATAHLTVAEGNEALAVAVAEPSGSDFHVGFRVGTRHPLDRGAAGKAILLGRGERQSDPLRLLRRKRPGGEYVTTSGELQAGARGLAAPVPDVDGLDASIGIITMSEIDVAVAVPAVVAAAAELSQRLAAER